MVKVPDFNLETTCSFTGHRILKKDFNEENLKEIIKEVLKRGYTTFLVGMARGFDLKCFEILLEEKKDYNIDIIACVPCKEQDKYFTLKEKEQYKNCIEKADKIIYISENYTDSCMIERNKYMVNNSSLLVAYYYSRIGGTHQTVSYAEKLNKEIIYFN